ncbi:MAG: hypothetical protein IPI68_05065 [Chitinophagaceae bacterium]|nr:hypothetical protein [Chitinophagaceae bacterium]
MRNFYLLFILSLILFSCSQKAGRYTPMEKGVLDTRTGDLYELKWKADLPDLQNNYFSKITGIIVTNYVKGTRREFEFKDETVKEIKIDNGEVVDTTN